MLANAVRVELSSAALPAHFKSRWIVLLNFLLAGSYIKLISVIVVIVAVWLLLIIWLFWLIVVAWLFIVHGRFTWASIALIVIILSLWLGYFATIALLGVRISLILVVFWRPLGRISIHWNFGWVITVVTINVFIASFVNTWFSIRIFVACLVIVQLISLKLVQGILIIVYILENNLRSIFLADEFS